MQHAGCLLFLWILISKLVPFPFVCLGELASRAIVGYMLPILTIFLATTRATRRLIADEISSMAAYTKNILVSSPVASDSVAHLRQPSETAILRSAPSASVGGVTARSRTSGKIHLLVCQLTHLFQRARTGDHVGGKTWMDLCRFNSSPTHTFAAVRRISSKYIYRGGRRQPLEQLRPT